MLKIVEACLWKGSVFELVDSIYLQYIQWCIQYVVSYIPFWTTLFLQMHLLLKSNCLNK